MKRLRGLITEEMARELVCNRMISGASGTSQLQSDIKKLLDSPHTDGTMTYQEMKQWISIAMFRHNGTLFWQKCMHSEACTYSVTF